MAPAQPAPARRCTVCSSEGRGRTRASAAKVGPDARESPRHRHSDQADFQCHDYDPPDNDVQAEVLRGRTLNTYKTIEGLKWVYSAIIGVVMGVIAFSVDSVIEHINEVKFSTLRSLVERGENAGAFMTYLLMCLVFATVAGSMVSYVEPLAAGSGIPELKTYLNGVHLRGLLRLKTLLAKVGGIVFSISAGLIAGKEGPFVHGGGLVGGGISAMGSRALSFALPSKFATYFRNDADKRDFVAIGTAAGVAVAFSAPIGGMLFTIEEGASFFSQRLLWRSFLATCSGVFTVHWLNQLKWDASDFLLARFGTHRDFGLFTDDQAGYSGIFWWYVWEVPIFVLMGAAGGLMGAMFIRANVRITVWRQRFIPVSCRHRRLLEVLVVAGVTALVAFSAMAISPCAPLPPAIARFMADPNATASVIGAGNRYEYDEKTLADIEAFYQPWMCPEGTYSTNGQLFASPLSHSLKYLIHLGEVAKTSEDEGVHTFHVGSLFTFFVLMFLLMTWTYGIGAPAGLFVPSLAVGAAFGQLVGRGVMYAAEADHLSENIDLHTYAVVGAAAMLGGATRMTISITLLVMETTGAMELIIPLMLSIFTAKWVGDRFGHGIYDAHIHIRGAPFLEEHDETGFPIADKLSAGEVMAQKMITVRPVMQVGDLVEILRTCQHSAFPVTERPQERAGEEVELLGLVIRPMLLNILHRRIAFDAPDVGTGRPGASDAEASQSPGAGRRAGRRASLFSSNDERDRLLEALKSIPFKPPHAEDLVLQGHELECTIDLRPFMQRHPFVVPADARLSRAYRQFRTLGLRHMFVAPERPRIVGMLTRKDLILENAQLTLLEKAADSAKSGVSSSYDLPFVPYYQNTEGDRHRSRSYGGEDDTEGFGGLSGARARSRGGGGGGNRRGSGEVEGIRLQEFSDVGASSLANVDL